MKSAEEFADSLFDYEGGEKWREHSAALIRARDKEMRDAYEKMLDWIFYEWDEGGSLEWDKQRAALDSVLGTLEGTV
jgi:hypothetical protein